MCFRFINITLRILCHYLSVYLRFLIKRPQVHKILFALYHNVHPVLQSILSIITFIELVHAFHVHRIVLSNIVIALLLIQL